MLYDRLLNDQPKFADRDAALYRSAWLMHAAGEEAAANDRFEQLVREFPASRYAADATLRLAERQFAEQHYDDVARLLAPLAADGVTPELRRQALYLSVRSIAAAGKWAEVEPAVTKLLAADPEPTVRWAVLYLAAEASYQQNQFAEAAERLAALAEQTRDAPQAWSAAAELSPRFRVLPN